MSRALLLLLLGLNTSLGCSCQPFGSVTARDHKQSDSDETKDQRLFRGMCDASAAVPLDAQRFAVADDEDNVLRIYDAERGGAPLYSIDLSAPLGLLGRKHVKEADIEAATRFGAYAFWLSSHGRNRVGKREHSRLRFFATTATKPSNQLDPIGHAYEGLLDDLLAAPELAAFDLANAARLPPKSPGGLNIEGLTAQLDGTALLIGFRNPIPQGRALLVPLRNPLEVLRGQRARFGAPILLDLGTLGVRALGLWRGRYLIAAGSAAADSGKSAQLFSWDGQANPKPLALDLNGFTPEAMVAFEKRSQLLLLSDDGTRDVDGVRCKDLLDPARKRFRGRWVELPRD